MERVKFTKGMATRLAERRKAKGLSQYALAEAVGAPRASVKRWECFEVKTIDAEVLLKIDALIGLQVSEPARQPTKAAKPARRGRPGVATYRSTERLRVDGPLVRYRIAVPGPASVDDLFGEVRIIDSKRKTTVTGSVCGVENSVKQGRVGFQAGEKVVIAVHTG